MEYPKKLERKNIVGVCAPSDGLIDTKYKLMCDRAKEKWNKKGIEVVYTDNCFNTKSGVSTNAKDRAKEFMQLWNDEKINTIISIGGGEYEMEVLEYLNFKNDNIKWFCGRSDNSILTYLLTTKYDIASIYGPNFYEMAIDHKVINDSFELLLSSKQSIIEIQDVLKCDYFYKKQEAEFEYNCDYKNEWKLFNAKDLDIDGMLIGGLLDDLSCICGTKYDNTCNFIEKYKTNGFIWYFDICDYNPAQSKRALWQLKNAGWFKYAKLIIFGRPLNQENFYDMTYIDNIKSIFESDIPIIFDFNIGHIPPSYSMVNGSIINVIYNKDKKEIITK
ncbi:MAG: LD-carboxypeptidase [Bacilli bacterium]|nr:LD-carboxypeptidase [Bacilli bacterium]